ncbi:MAG: NhaP-type Na+/H+ or K+/H+ antiporter [Halobacteriales archaeon]|jgi:NhaP-type Na+/H+ or K+/H+ antiporter
MTATVEIIRVVVTILGLGVAAQVLADRLRVPSVVFLILAGVLVGPEGLGFVTPGVFGDALPAVVGLSVAIIVFEGAFHLDLDRLRGAPRETFRLVTIGAAISLFGTAAIVRFVIGATWELSLVIGALLIATGPTVITPIMSVVPVRERVATTLETEGVVNDVTAAIMAIVLFEFVLIETRPLPMLVGEFGRRFGTGILVGVAVALVAWFVLRHIDLSVENAPQNSRLIVLASALVMYGVAELFAAEAGIAAVAAGGFVLGNVDIPYRDTIEQFKGDLSLLVISFVFITLASLLSLQDFRVVGLGGIVAVVLIAGILRPAFVLLCTIGDRLTLRERLYVGAIGPRGIIPASVATLFALELQSIDPTGATTLVGTVFLVIFATVVFEGGLARHIAQGLDVIPKRIIIVGGGRVGQALAERVEDRGEEVTIIESSEAVVEELREEGFAVHHGDGTHREVLSGAGAGNAKVVAASTGDDDVNMLIGQIAKNTFDIDRIVARVNEPSNADAFEDLDIETISDWMSVAWSMDNIIERPGIARWMTELDRNGDVQEVEVTADSTVGKTVSDLSEELPEDCHIALISRDESNRLPHPGDVIDRGDHLTFIGRKEAVREAMRFCEA